MNRFHQVLAMVAQNLMKDLGGIVFICLSRKTAEMIYNVFGEVIKYENIQESAFDCSKISFIIKLPSCGYLNINDEYLPNKNTTLATGRFHVYHMDPIQVLPPIILKIR